MLLARRVSGTGRRHFQRDCFASTLLAAAIFRLALDWSFHNQPMHPVGFVVSFRSAQINLLTGPKETSTKVGHIPPINTALSPTIARDTLAPAESVAPTAGIFLLR